MPTMPRTRNTPTVYLLHLVAGLADIAAAEVQQQIDDARVTESLRGFDERTDVLIVRTAAPPAGLLGLRTVEDIFAEALTENDIPAARAGLSRIRTAVAHSRRLEGALAVALAARGRRGRRHTFRVVARKAGEHAFRRVDVQYAVERAFLDRFPAWRLVEDEAQVEIWVHLVGHRLIAGTRLSDIALRNRTYRRVSLPAALKPSVAAAMVRLSPPVPEDVFLDPMCGSGTILIERALAGRYALLLGGDSDPDAVAATRENVGRRYQPIEIRQWDARSLPLADGAVGVIVCNLPFGKQIGSVRGNRTLYPALIEEWTRVLRPDGRMVLLESERALLMRAVEHQTGLRIRQAIPVQVRGQRATIFVVAAVTRS
jgi:precorrin-6B methylase 2